LEAVPYVFFALALSVVSAAVAAHFWRRCSLLDSAFESSLEFLEPGIRMVHSRVRCPGDLLESPLTRSPCIYYRVLVTQSGRFSDRRRTLADVEKRIPHVVLEGPGTPVEVLVHKADREITTTTRSYRGEADEKQSGEVRACLETLGLEKRAAKALPSTWIQEQRIDAEQKILVLGEVERVKDKLVFRGGDPFLVSTMLPEDLVSHYRGFVIFWLKICAFFVLLSVVLLATRP
jgi:hypothetical protein